MTKISAIDLFCGAGGLTYGLELAGVPVVEGVDIDGNCAFAYEYNNSGNFVERDVAEYTAKDAFNAWNGADVKILAGCAPCQPFSTYSQGSRGNHENKWAMINRFAELIRETDPEIVTMENVALLRKTETFENFVHALKKSGYSVSHHIAECHKYGAPQTRRRLVLLASKFGAINLLPPTHEDPSTWVDVEKAIGKLRPLEAGEQAPRDPMHRSSKLSDLNLARIRASKQGGTWRDWPEDLIADCHKKPQGKSYPGVYARMSWKKPGPTMTGQCYGYGNGRFGHPEQDRAISLREAAILQTFPKSYKFIRPGTFPGMRKIGQMIGNAVPPLLGKVIGESIQLHLEQHKLT